jgi:hypothetical protein
MHELSFKPVAHFGNGHAFFCRRLLDKFSLFLKPYLVRAASNRVFELMIYHAKPEGAKKDWDALPDDPAFLPC